MGISPRRSPILVTDDISVGNIHTAHIAHLTINDDNLAVVAPIDAEGHIGE